MPAILRLPTFSRSLTLLLATAVAGPAALPADDAETLEVTIERAPFSIRPAASYDIPLKLEPKKRVTLVALTDGVLQAFRVQPGDKADAQQELVRQDGKLLQLRLDRAAAALAAAEEQSQQGTSARLVDVAKADVSIAQLQLDQAIIRMPWAGVVLEVHAAEGQFVRAGDPLVTVADPTDLYVDVPIDRASARIGDNVELKIEEVSVTGKLTAILPLSARFDPLRGLFPSIASGRVEVDNSDGKFLTGQTVYSPMIPRRPVGEVPTAALSNADGGEGERKVQVIRDGVVRDVAVQLLGQVGEDHVWVSGLFGEQDELILRTSEPLTDGSVVTPSSLVGGAPGAAAPNAGGRQPGNFLDSDF